MKKGMQCLVVMALLLLPKLLSAQNYPYQFAANTATYTPLDTTATVLLDSVGWDDTTVNITLPFSFKLMDHSGTAFFVDANGGLDDADFFEFPRVMGFNCDYRDRGNSQILSQTIGASPNRITKIEYRNVGFWSEDASLNTDSANFQIWLYEGTNKIEYHAGPSYTHDEVFDINHSLMAIGLVYTVHGVGDANAIDTFHILGNVNNSTKDSVMKFNINELGTDLSQFNFVNYGKFPANSTVYTFTPPATTGIHELKTTVSLSAYPNPASESIVLSLAEKPSQAWFKVADVTGKVLWFQPIENKVTVITLATLPAGSYYGIYEDTKHIGNMKFVKQ